MGYEENYCIVSYSSIGGWPLEEASEQERIPSIIGSIVWCCPTSRVSIIKLWFSIWFHISCVVIVFRYLWIYCYTLYSGIWFLTGSPPSLINSWGASSPTNLVSNSFQGQWVTLDLRTSEDQIRYWFRWKLMPPFQVPSTTFHQPSWSLFSTSPCQQSFNIYS